MQIDWLDIDPGQAPYIGIDVLTGTSYAGPPAPVLSTAYLAGLRQFNTPDTVLEVLLDGGTKFWGYYNTTTDVRPILKTVSPLQNKLDVKTGYTTLGQMTAVISGRENLRSLIANNYLNKRRVYRKDGFLGMDYADYEATYTGTITDWSRKGDELTLTVSDDLIDAKKKVPEETAAKTQYIDFTSINPVDAMTALLVTHLGIPAAQVNLSRFAAERDNWLNSWTFSRVLTEPKEATEYLKELQEETNSFIIHDGKQISYKVFAPPLPTEPVEGWTNDLNIINGSFSQKSGYKDAFYNRVVVNYDYDESGGDKEESFESRVIDSDTVSSGSAQHDEERTKTINARWIRTYSFSHDNISGLKPYHVSVNNSAGTGTLTFTYDAGGKHTLKWTPPGDTTGEAVTISKDGKFQIFGADKTKWVRVLVTTADLPGGNTTGGVTLTAINGLQFATAVARKILNRFRDPAAMITFQVDIRNTAYDDVFIKPTDLKDITTDEAFEFGEESWSTERVMLTSVRPDFERRVVDIEAIETKMYHRYGFIAPAGYPDYSSATAEQKKRAFIGRASDNKVYDGAAYVSGYYTW